MNSPDQKVKTDRSRLHLALICWALAAVGLVWAVSFNISAYRTAMREARDYQEEKAQELAMQIQNYGSTATQLAGTLRIFLERYRGRDQQQIETYLEQFLTSAPRDLIYGIGVWWEPYAFDPNRKHFGPYAYRAEPNSEPLITYEWNNHNYDYHQQFWYKAGLEATSGPFVTDAYIERGIVYISLLQPFDYPESGGRKGVISIDMVVPKMQSIVKSLGTYPSDIVMVAGKSGHVMVHSQPEQLLATARQLHPDQDIKSVLNVRLADGLVGFEDRLSHSKQIANLGWTIVILSHQDDVMVGYHRIRRVITLATLVYLVVLALGHFTINHFRQSLQEQKVSILYAEKMASLGEMAGSIAHEINNPLAVIQGAAQKLQLRLRQEELNREDIKQTAALILKTTERITRIIRSLRFVTRDGSVDPFVNTSIHNIVDETLALCEAKLKSEGIELDARGVPDDLFCVCRGVQISQVLINLINNAVDAIHELSEKWIRLEAYAQGNWIHIAVTDSGNGIPKEIADKIMQPFFTTKSAGKGTGLGLSISRSIAQAHGGELYVDHSCAHTRFILCLPRAHENLQSA